MPRQRPRRTTPRPQNMGQNRNTQMRNNARRPGTFQGGLSRNQGITPQGTGQPPAQNRQQCPPGQMPGRNPISGAQTCVPERPNISSDVPIKNAQRAIAPGAGKPPKPGY